MHIDERLSLTTYLRQTTSTIDGQAWFATCAASFVCLIDVLLSTNFLPIRDALDPPKAIVLLLFSPLLVFLSLVCFRQMPSANNKASSWFRAAVCIFVFLSINF